jgi:hypothetical protein
MKPSFLKRSASHIHPLGVSGYRRIPRGGNYRFAKEPADPIKRSREPSSRGTSNGAITARKRELLVTRDTVDQAGQALAICARRPVCKAHSRVDDCAENDDPENHHEGHPDPFPSMHPVHGNLLSCTDKDRRATLRRHPRATTYPLAVTTELRAWPLEPSGQGSGARQRCSSCG